MKLSFWKLSALALTTSLLASAPIAAQADTGHKHMEKGHNDKDGHHNTKK